ncbi:hypothetical protein E3E35_01445 [Thermococcus sp. GR7]|uniref:hypothetical protein n=1 Tax=unclassified Thermococcus TaxID=2627626 RepID=UPI001431B436|nr:MULTISPECIES: hypothetical protein [unclassified Thermococcus]NJE46094.1 hypothetical protein [Thermococcus sp. GR7]NJE78270.1 hypothetical protein [Thermococcus sp. GR4]NJF22291.1 hypothetical protein [Thermococcus sp. GR5]
MKIKRRLFSVIPLALLFALLARIDGRILFLIPLGLMGIQWYFIGSLFLVTVGAFLIYTRTGGLYGLAIIALTLLAIEMGYLDRERAPKEHYFVVLAAVVLAFPTYLLMESISPALPRLEVTALAAFLLIALYVFAKAVAES